MRCAIYARVSTIGNGQSPEMQRAPSAPRGAVKRIQHIPSWPGESVVTRNLWNLDEDERHVVCGRPVAPRGYPVQDLLLHFR